MYAGFPSFLCLGLEARHVKAMFQRSAVNITDGRAMFRTGIGLQPLRNPLIRVLTMAHVVSK